MKHNWEYKRLGDCLISLKTGLNPRNNFVLNEDGASNYYVTVRELDGRGITITDNTDKFCDYAFPLINHRSNLEKGDVLFSGTGTIGKTALVTETPSNWNIKEGVYALKPKSYLDSVFLLYILHTESLLAYCKNSATGATIISVPMAKLANCPIPVPPMEVQERIVAELDDINAMIEGKHEQLKQLDLLAQSVFYTMFGDPVTNPKGWEESKLIDCIADGCSISYGIVQPGDDFPDGVPVVRPIDLIGGKYVKRDNLKTVDPAISDTYKRTILLGNEILMCVRGTTGVIRMADISLKDANVTRGITPLRIKNSINVTYMFEYLKQQKAQEFIKYYTKGTTLKQINMADLRNLPVNLPPADLQEKFAAKIEAIEAQKADIEATIKELQTLLDSRMDYWFN